MKKNILLAIAIAVVGLMITSAASSLSIQETTSEVNEINAQSAMVQSQSIPKITNEPTMQPLSRASTQITGGDYDEYHPSIAGSPAGEYYAMYEYSEDGFIWHPMLSYSEDGLVWTALVEFLYDNAEYTDMDQNSHGTYGTFGAPPDNSGNVVVVQGEIADGWVWDFGPNDINEFSYNRIACYTFQGPDGDPGTWNWGGLAFTGYNGYAGAIVGCPFIFYQYSDAGGGVIGWLTGDVEGCKNTGSAMDLATNMHYAVYDRNTGEGNFDLLVRKDDFGAWTYNSGGDYWTHDYITSASIEDETANLMYPSAAAYNDNVVVACQKDNDVVVFYSLNGFSSHTEVAVETDASYPEVSMACGGLCVITYIKGGTLYMRTSDTGGASWSAASVVSDAQPNLNDRAANLDEYGGDVIGCWEDTRGANIDIYWDTVYDCPNDPPGAPTITGTDNGDVGKSYEYKFNAVDPEGDDVRYIIDWGDENTDTTAYATSGTDVPFSHTWTDGGTFTITAKAQDTFGNIGPETTKTVKMPRSKAMNFPFLQFLQNHPNLFPILRQLLGL